MKFKSPLMKFGDLAAPGKGHLVSGPFGSNISSKFFVPKGVPVIRGNNLTLGKKKFVDNGFVFITDEKAEELKNCNAIENDILITAAGTLGQVGILSGNLKYKKYIISNKQIRLRCNTKIVNPMYLYHFLSWQYMRSFLQSQNKGSSIPLLTLGSLRWIPIPVPPLPTQQKIAAILSAYDDLIKNNLQRIKLLEEMAQITYEEWFVRMKFPGHEYTPIAPETGLPEGWVKGCIGDIFRFKNGYAFKSQSYSDNQTYKIVTIKNVQDGYFIPECTDSLKGLPANLKPYQHLKDSDIIISLTGNVGRVCLVYGNDYLLNQRVAKIEANQNFDKALSYFFFRSRHMITYLESISNGAAQQNLSPIIASKLKITIASEDTRNKFQAFAFPIIQTMIILNNQNNLLKEARDILLPRLMTGMIDVDAIELPETLLARMDVEDSA